MLMSVRRVCVVCVVVQCVAVAGCPLSPLVVAVRQSRSGKACYHGQLDCWIM